MKTMATGNDDYDDDCDGATGDEVDDDGDGATRDDDDDGEDDDDDDDDGNGATKGSSLHNTVEVFTNQKSRLHIR